MLKVFYITILNLKKLYIYLYKYLYIFIDKILIKLIVNEGMVT